MSMYYLLVLLNMFMILMYVNLAYGVVYSFGLFTEHTLFLLVFNYFATNIFKLLENHRMVLVIKIIVIVSFLITLSLMILQIIDALTTMTEPFS
jgi:hypothetical protein